MRRNSGQAQASEDIVQMTVGFLEKEATFQRWARLYQADGDWDDNPGPPRGSRLYYACFDGLTAPARDLIGKGADVNAQGGRYGNALQAASYGGYQEIVKLLLDNGADANAQGGESSEGGCQKTVKLLQNNGAIIPSSKQSGAKTPSNPAKKLLLIDAEPSDQTR